MQHLDKLIPLIALAGVGLLLLYLMRLARGERAIVIVPEKPSAPVPVAAPVVLPLAAPVIVEEKKETPVEMPVVVKPMPVKSQAAPVHSVLELLQSKDALTQAFLLREILGPPVSRRR